MEKNRLVDHIARFNTVMSCEEWFKKTKVSSRNPLYNMTKFTASTSMIYERESPLRWPQNSLYIYDVMLHTNEMTP